MGFLYRATKFMILPLAIVLIWYRDANAYIDPAAGSYFFQLIMAGVLGGLFVTRRFWHGLRTKFANILNKSQRQPGD